MKQVINLKGVISVQDVPPPVCGRGDVKVALTHSLISSGTETHTLQVTGQNLVSRAKDRPDLVKKVVDRVKTQGVMAAYRAVHDKLYEPKSMGYSCTGVVAEVGADVTRFAPGDRVSCGGASAGHGEVVCVPENLVVHVPDGVESRHAAFATLGAIAMQGVRRAQPELGDNFVVLGLGLVGQLCVQMAKAAGVHVLGFDLARDRVELALKMGADAACVLSEVNPIERVLDFTGGVGADAVIVAAATSGSQPINDAIAMARERGRISIVGIIGLDMQHGPFYDKELDVYMSRSYGPGRYDYKYEGRGLDYPISFVRWTENRNMGEVLRLIGQERIDVEPLISKVFRIDDAEKAYALLREEGVKPLGIVLEYPDSAKAARDSVPVPKAVPKRVKKSAINIAVVGCGSFAKTQRLPYLKQLGTFNLAMLVSLPGANVKQLAAEYGVAKYSADYHDAVADPDIDLILIATPNSLHAPITFAAAEAGKDVLAEKPIAVNPEELEAVYAAVKASGIRYTCGFNRRYAPASVNLKAFVDTKREPKCVLYRCNVGLLPPGHFMHPPEEGGGLVVGEDCHFFDYCTWLIGAKPVSVSGAAISYEGAHFVGSDNLSSVIRYGDGSTATIVYTTMGNATLPKEHVEVYTGGACAVLDDYTSLKFYGARGKAWSGMQDKGHKALLDVMGKRLCAGEDMPIGLEASYQSHVLTFKALEAARTGAVIAL